MYDYNYGVLTETTPVYDSLKYGDDAQLYYWNNIANIPSATPYEGSNVLALAASANNWFGWGVDNQPKYMMNYQNGSIRFQFKTSYTGQFKVGVKSGHGESWIDFPANVSKYGVVRDGAWHEVSIPLAAFDQPNLGMHIDLGSMNALFMFAGNAPSANTEFYFDNIYYAPCVSGACPLLPVKLSAYDVKSIENRKVLVSWTTATELNNDHFIIERSANGTTFQKIATVNAEGNSNVARAYSYTDNSPYKGVSYYRLAQVDKDGKRTVYDIKRVNLTGKVAEITVYPNPVKASVLGLNFSNPVQKKIKLQLLDMSGRIVLDKTESVSGTTLKVSMGARLAPGMYLLKVDGKVESRVIVE